MSKDSQHAALQSYLNALLLDAEPESEPELELQSDPAAAVRPVALLDKPHVISSLPRVALLEPLISEAQIRQLPVSVSVIEEQQESALPEAAVVSKSELDKTGWSNSAFECLLFDVAGLTLAVPLTMLGSIYSFEPDQLTPLFGQPDWFVGILSTPAGNLKILETARWVMPERYNVGMRKDLKFVISINGCDWGLAVHQVRHSIRLEPSAVKWRTDRSKRAWLAGTVIEHMCALLDVEVLAQLITDQDVPISAAQAGTEKL